MNLDNIHFEALRFYGLNGQTGVKEASFLTLANSLKKNPCILICDNRLSREVLILANKRAALLVASLVFALLIIITFIYLRWDPYIILDRLGLAIVTVMLISELILKILGHLGMN